MAVALKNISLQLSATAPHVPEEIQLPFNDLYLAFYNLLQQLNDSQPVMMSPNGHFWVATISNAGVVTWTDVGTTRP